MNKPAHGEDPVQKLLEESGVPSSEGLSNALEAVRALANGPVPEVAAELAQLMAAGGAQPRGRRNRHRATFIGGTLAISMGLGMSGVAAGTMHFPEGFGRTAEAVIHLHGRETGPEASAVDQKGNAHHDLPAVKQSGAEIGSAIPGLGDARPSGIHGGFDAVPPPESRDPGATLPQPPAPPAVPVPQEGAVPAPVLPGHPAPADPKHGSGNPDSGNPGSGNPDSGNPPARGHWKDVLHGITPGGLHGARDQADLVRRPGPSGELRPPGLANPVKEGAPAHPARPGASEPPAGERAKAGHNGAGSGETLRRRADNGGSESGGTAPHPGTLPQLPVEVPASEPGEKEPATPQPAVSEPAVPEPAVSDPAAPERAPAEPVTAETADPDPDTPGSAVAGLAPAEQEAPDKTVPEAAREQAESAPAASGPAVSTPVEPDPADPEPVGGESAAAG